MEKDIELIILMNSERVIGKKLLREASQSFVKIGKDELSFLEEKLLLDFCYCLGKAVKKKMEVESFYNIIQKESPI